MLQHREATVIGPRDNYLQKEKGIKMRSASLIGLSIMLMGSTIAPASAFAQGGPSASGSCGYRAGEYGMNNLSPLDVRNPNRGSMNVGTVHTQIQYSGIQPGSQLKIITTSGSLNRGPDLGATGAIRTVTAQSSSGTFAFSANQTENGATRFAARGDGVGGLTRSNKGHPKQGGTSSAGQSNGANLYFFQAWMGDQLIGQFTCGVEDRE